MHDTKKQKADNLTATDDQKKGNSSNFLKKIGELDVVRKAFSEEKLLNKNLKKQMLIPFITTIAVIGLIGGLFSYFYGEKMTKDQLIESTQQQLHATNGSFNTYFSDAEANVHQFGASSLLSNPKKNSQSLNTMFQNLLDANTKYQAITYASANKVAVRAPLYFFNQGYDPTKENWYKEGIKAGGDSYWTSPYNDPVLKQQVVSVVQEVKADGSVLGVMKMDLYIQNIINEVRNAKYGQTGYSELLDRDGDYIATPDKKDTNKNVSNQAFYKELMKSGKSGMFYASIDGQQKLICFERNQTTGWILLGIINKSEVTQTANLIALPSAVTVIIILIIAVLLTNFLLNRIIRRLRSIQHASERVQHGDLTVAIPIVGNDELANLMTSINEMARENRKAFQKVNRVSDQIKAASETLVASVEENVASANEISATVTEIAAGAANQSTAIDQNQNSIDTLVDKFKTMKARSDEVLSGSVQMSATSKNGQEIMTQLAKQSKASSASTEQIIQAVQELEQHAQSVTEIVTVLDGIARRTNLLSLNASIEAAHAGEHGKGFAVVAGEIRKLAQQTNTSLKQVAETINAVTEKTAEAVKLGKSTGEMLQSQGRAVEQSNAAFQDIEQTIEKSVAGIREIADAIRSVNDHIEQISQGSQTIASTSEETAASTEEVSASVQEQTAAMEELNKLAGDLEKQADLMNQSISRFKI